MRRLKAGEHVRVKGYDISAQKYGYDERMENMVGKTFSSAKSLDDDAECVHINGIYMSIKDMAFPNDKDPKPQIFLFDESVIEGVQNHGHKT